MLKKSQNPPQRWPEGRSLSEDSGNWWAVYTKPRHEKALAWELKRLGINYYLPMTTKRARRRDNGKPRKSLICLFPGYVSLVDFPKHRLNVLRTGRIARVIEIKDQGRFVRELEQIVEIARRDLNIEIHYDLAIVQEVLIASGPFKGIKGIIGDLAKRNRVYFNVEMFGRAVSMEVDSSILVPADN